VVVMVMKIINKLLLALAIILLFACAHKGKKEEAKPGASASAPASSNSALFSKKTPDIDAARNASFPNQPFKEKLRTGYIELADYEWGKGDEEAAKRFGRKAIATTLPNIDPDMEGVFDRDINLNLLNEMLGAKYYIESAFAAGAKEQNPDDAAKAQLNFDCWVEQAASKMPDERPCKDDFNSARASMATFMQTANYRTSAQPQRTAAPRNDNVSKELAMQKAALLRMPEYSLIFFKFNSTKLGITAEGILDKVAADIKLFKPRKVILSGNTDNIGDYMTNVKLALGRGQAVADYLIKNHDIDPDVLDVKAYGLNNPRVEHENLKKEVRNRYVQIIFQKDNRMYYDNDSGN
jgi:OOP family OmpA-OmpF porin